MLLAVTPLPSPDSTPPVTTTYLMQPTGSEAVESRISRLAMRLGGPNYSMFKYRLNHRSAWPSRPVTGFWSQVRWGRLALIWSML